MMETGRLTVEGIRRGLGEYADTPVFLYDEIDSTNSQAKRYAAEAAGEAGGAPCPALLVARRQTAGRGRLGRSFFSPPYSGLYMTLLWCNDGSLDQAVAVTGAAAVATARAIAAVSGVEVGIKWVNDLYLRERKLCGILAESTTPRPGETYIAVGIGINLTTAAFPADLRAPAISLSEVLPPDTPIDPSRLCGRIAGDLLSLLDRRALTALETLDDYRRRLILHGRRVIATRGDETWEGVVRGVDDAYGLLLDTPSGLLTLHSGEVSLRLSQHS